MNFRIKEKLIATAVIFPVAFILFFISEKLSVPELQINAIFFCLVFQGVSIFFLFPKKKFYDRLFLARFIFIFIHIIIGWFLYIYLVHHPIPYNPSWSFVNGHGDRLKISIIGLTCFACDATIFFGTILILNIS